jgi:hypothetical protein
MNYNYEASTSSPVATLLFWLFFAVIAVIAIAAMWRIYQKADKPGWASIIPFYSMYVLFDIALGNGILFLLLFVPIVNYIALIVVYYKLAKSFGKGIGFTIGIIFLPIIFLPILGFGNAEYYGPQ